MEIVFSRYLYSLSFLRSCSGFVNELRKAKEEKNNTRCAEILKSIMERLSNATVRILKLKDQERLIFVRNAPINNSNFTSQDLKERMTVQNLQPISSMPCLTSSR